MVVPGSCPGMVLGGGIMPPDGPMPPVLSCCWLPWSAKLAARLSCCTACTLALAPSQMTREPCVVVPVADLSPMTCCSSSSVDL